MSSQDENDRQVLNMNQIGETETEKIQEMYCLIYEDTFVLKVNVGKVDQDIVKLQRLPTKREVNNIFLPITIHAKQFF